MLRFVLTIIAVTLATIAWGIAIRGDVAYGGEMIIPVLAIAYMVLRKEGDDGKKEERR